MGNNTTATSAPSRRSTRRETATEQPQPAQPLQGNERLLLDALQSGRATVLALAFNVPAWFEAGKGEMDLPPGSYAVVMLHENPPDLSGLYSTAASP
jgi:hypothetical protein